MTAKIRYADLYGAHAHKYAALLNSDQESVVWQEITPNAPFYLFGPQEQELREEYELGWSATNIFRPAAFAPASRRAPAPCCIPPALVRQELRGAAQKVSRTHCTGGRARVLAKQDAPRQTGKPRMNEIGTRP